MKCIRCGVPFQKEYLLYIQGYRICHHCIARFIQEYLKHLPRRGWCQDDGWGE